MISAEQAILLAEKVVSEEVVSTSAERVDKEPELNYAFRTTSGESSLCWIAYFKTSNLFGQDSVESQYIKVYIDAATDENVDLIYISDIEDYRTSNEVYNNDIYFKDVKTEMMTFTDYQGITVELPV